MTDLKESSRANLASPELVSNSSDEQEENSNSSSDEEQKCNGESPTRRRSSLHNLRFRAQKHLVGRMVTNRQSIKPLIGKKAYTALKQFELLLKSHMSSSKDVKALIRSVVKTIGKLGVVAKQNTLTENQMSLARTAKQQFNTVALTVISFVRTDYTYNRGYLSQLLRDCEQTVCKCVVETLSSKSVDRINFVFDTLCDPTLMDNVFSLSAKAEQRKHLVDLTESLEIMIASSRRT
ncbi:unnamed protein product [Echinostoma caproni]|uniref:Tumor necrosis factor alpha-induced protein 8-like protein n=1 Tax=Echinostoma caproni TaxID=27848 RepID=A0A183B5A2_9TREM|nr:unnamed protein product [Echinostoma caproni]